MPVSKKKVYKESKFKRTLGYRNNAHRDKSGRTQQEREAERLDRQHNRELNNRLQAQITQEQILNTIKDMGQIMKKKEVK